MGKKPETEQTDELSADARFVRRAADVLNASMSGLPPSVTARLNSIRESAVASADADLQRASMTSEPATGSAVLARRNDSLPTDVVDRLDDIRARAMQRAAQRSQRGHGLLTGWRERLDGLSFGVPAGAFASICVLVTTLAIFNLLASEEPIPASLAEDVLLLASVDDIELYENLEFYQWLAENGL